jgi:hypothetical protein
MLPAVVNRPRCLQQIVGDTSDGLVPIKIDFFMTNVASGLKQQRRLATLETRLHTTDLLPVLVPINGWVLPTISLDLDAIESLVRHNMDFGGLFIEVDHDFIANLPVLF